MPGYNKVIQIGHLTRDPETKHLPSGSTVCEFGIAVNKKWVSKDGQTKEEACFTDCVAFGKTGEFIQKYFTRGKAILIDGELVFDKWQAPDGTNRSKHRIRVERATFVESKQGIPHDADSPRTKGPQPPPDSAPAQQYAPPPAAAPAAQAAPHGYDPATGEATPF